MQTSKVNSREGFDLICKKIDRMLKVGVLGAGHLGKIHIRLLKELENYDLIGFYDPNTESATEMKVLVLKP